MFSDSLDNEARKMGTHKMKSAMATPEEVEDLPEDENKVEQVSQWLPPSVQERQRKEQMKKAKKKNKKKKKHTAIWVILLLIFVGVFVYSGYMFATEYIGLRQDAAKLSALSDTVTTQPRSLKITSGGELVEVKEEEYGVSTQKKESRLEAYQSLAAKNSDMIGWLEIPGTVINYPVMYTPNDGEGGEYYIHRDFDGNYSASGVLFVDKACDPVNGDNQIIYGHAMKNGTMFGELNRYEEKSYWENHKYIYYDSLTEEHVYQVVCAFNSRVLDKDERGFRYYSFTGSGGDEQAFDNYVSSIMSRRIYDTGVDVKFGDKLITLSTCAYYVEDGRFVVVAKQVG
jgi:sortase B